MCFGRRTRTAIQQCLGRAVHRNDGTEHYSVFRRYGYQIQRNQTHPYSRYCPVNRRCIAYHLIDRYISYSIFPTGTEPTSKLTCWVPCCSAATMSSTRLCICVQPAPLPTHEPETESAPLCWSWKVGNDPMAYMLTIVADTGDFKWKQSWFSTDYQRPARAVLLRWGNPATLWDGSAYGWLTVSIHPTARFYSILLLSLVFITFTITDQLKGNAYSAVYIMGVILEIPDWLTEKKSIPFMGADWPGFSRLSCSLL